MTDETIKPAKDEIDYLQSPTVAKLMPALIDAVGEFDPVLKDATNPHFRSKYSSLSSIIKAVQPALQKHRLMQSQPTTVDHATGKNIVVTRVVHESGEWIAARWVITPAKQDPQGEGSALSYARRYTLTSLLGIASEDDDGNEASRSTTRQEAPRVPLPPAGPESSGRNWRAEAAAMAQAPRPATERRRELLALMNECQAFGEMNADLQAELIRLGNGVKAELEAAQA